MKITTIYLSLLLIFTSSCDQALAYTASKYKPVIIHLIEVDLISTVTFINKFTGFLSTKRYGLVPVFTSSH